MSIDGGSDFFYGTGEPGTGVVSIVLDEDRNNVITIAPPVPNPLGLLANPATITIPAGTLDAALDCPADYNVIFNPPETNAFITIHTVDDAGADVLGTIELNGTPVSDLQCDVVDLEIDPSTLNTFTFGSIS